MDRVYMIGQVLISCLQTTIKRLEKENEELKAQLLSKEVAIAEKEEVNEVELSEEPKPISFNPENTNPIEVVKIASKRPRSIMDSVLSKLNK